MEPNLAGIILRMFFDVGDKKRLIVFLQSSQEPAGEMQ